MSASEGPDAQREEWQEKYAYIQSYLEQTKDNDSHSATTETSESGLGAQSEHGIWETSGKIRVIIRYERNKLSSTDKKCIDD